MGECGRNVQEIVKAIVLLIPFVACVQIVTNPHLCIEIWGQVLAERLRILEVWALRQGLELAADCHLAKINQCAKFLMVCAIVVSVRIGVVPVWFWLHILNLSPSSTQSPKTTDAEVKQLARKQTAAAL